MFVVVALFIVVLCFYVSLSVLKPKRFPPGPPWKPFVGSRPDFQRAMEKTGYQHAAFSLLASEWKTNVLGLKLGNEMVVSVEDFPTIEMVLNSRDYDQRPTNFFFKLRNFGTSKGITCAHGELWSNQRKFLSRYLNVITTKELDLNINREVQNLFQELESSKSVNIMDLLRYTVFNILWSIVAGKRVCSKVFEKNQLMGIMARRTKAFDMAGGILSQYPWLRFFIPERSGYSLIKNLNREMKAFLVETIDDHRRTWVKGSESDFIHSYISKMKEEHDEHFTDEQLFFVCLDLFIGGFSTTALTLGFIFLTMVRHQDVQSKIQKMLDQHFEDGHQWEYQDRYKVPYVEAVIKEIQRHKSISPIFGPRATARDTQLNGYTIPKGTTVLLNMQPTWMSEEIWGDPEEFRPERFLDERGQMANGSKFVPFGIGRRKCPADSFAQRSLFVIVTKLLKQYRVLPVDEDNPPSMKPIPGMLLSPTQYLCRFERRTK
ncbi:probable cytochrome P450 305a1 isoform X2 [Photinus pyralis]|uniref:probable cytochrome P450 305a1 isoform X2 n=1 Tax=Photinus pyralis TaxID=7054 RepID=UPI0012673A45|nr:probable cytochrome P450 305a1 isoform X2 [Photinus pyralis]